MYIDTIDDMNDLKIRPELEPDYEVIRNIVAESFSSAPHTDGDEHNLIDRIRKTDDYIPELSLVAVYDGHIVGHIMMSRIYVEEREALALAPLAVLPKLQGKGVGSRLVKEAHKLAMTLGYEFSVVLGDPAYYSRFGYITASTFGVLAPFDVPEPYFMVSKLNQNTLIPTGIVKYSKAFDL